ncbi:hypothetical protein ITJ66_05915 [Plantibacter sp. VKM Ac-2885]|uniref:hypothetical protein n=1 Tax=Plantibacter sp. VKM Ac-2885 TaxID=2783828 RepID=UPI00188ABCD9|nr:hypothetical protein [Plantibacter sp. VKM Ac-2885]MBF4512021.1 hypothetical protein [Plantibacter sp. VKM Ac-2885]
MSNVIIPQVAIVRTAEQEQAVLDWAAQVREIHARDSRPFEENDLRTAALIEASNKKYGRNITEIPEDFSPEDLGRFYFDDVSELPAFPIAPPAWATETKVLKSQYPDIVIEWEGAPRTAGGGQFLAFIEQMGYVVVDEDSGELHGQKPAAIGDNSFDAAHVFVRPVGELLTADDAISLAFCIDEAGQELAQHELKAARA